MKNKSKKGFTLVEIMIVVVIIGLLAALAIPAFQGVRERSLQSIMDNDARQISAAATQYFLEQPVSTVTLSVLTSVGPDGEQPYLGGYSNKFGIDGTTVVTSGGTIVLTNASVNGGAEVAYYVDTGRRVEEEEEE